MEENIKRKREREKKREGQGDGEKVLMTQVVSQVTLSLMVMMKVATTKVPPR